MGEERSGSKSAKALAVLLMLGGVVGIGIALFAGYQLAQAHWAYGLLMALLLALFAWSALTGVRLWRDDPRGWKWAIILFAAQIPVLAIPGLTYEYFTGIAVKVLGGGVEGPLSFGIGAGANIFVGGAAPELAYGVNLVAVAALAWLLWRRPRPAVASTGGTVTTANAAPR
ncbi:MAG TPA: hypothetical protein VMR74_01445 [Gammaproteobacteria bacterium]|nr:hypothetical protein [Gammaproteobacteria bacterium]